MDLNCIAMECVHPATKSLPPHTRPQRTVTQHSSGARNGIESKQIPTELEQGLGIESCEWFTSQKAKHVEKDFSRDLRHPSAHPFVYQQRRAHDNSFVVR